MQFRREKKTSLLQIIYGEMLVYEGAHCPQAHQNGQSISLQMYVRSGLLIPSRWWHCPLSLWEGRLQKHPAHHLLGLQRLLEATRTQIRIWESEIDARLSFSCSLSYCQRCFPGRFPVELMAVGWFRAGAASCSPHGPLCIKFYWEHTCPPLFTYSSWLLSWNNDWTELWQRPYSL